MSTSGRMPWALACMILAGCTTSQHLNTDLAPDWESDELASRHAANAPSSLPPLAAVAPALPAVSNAPSNPARPESHDTWLPLFRWSRANGLSEPLRINTTPLPSFSLRASGGTILLRVGSRLADFEGIQLHLGFAPQLIGGAPFVHWSDMKSSISPLLNNFSLTKTNPIIVIDPGHGGENAGARSVSGRHYEKEYTFDWACRLRALLETNGWQVWLTRPSDVDLALSNRVSFAEAHKADVFISLHFNSSGEDESQSGLETYCLTPVGLPSTVTRGYPDDLSTAYPNNGYDAQNIQFACGVHRALLHVNGVRDRGIRRARFTGVLRNQQRPAILVEGGYLSNASEARLIGQPAYRQKLAEAVASGINSVWTRPLRAPEPAVDSASELQRSSSQQSLRDQGAESITR